MAQVVNHIEYAMMYLIPMEEDFTPVHPELAEYLTVILKGLDSCIDVIKAFCTKAWGFYPKDWESWRNERKPKEDTVNDNPN
jgi:hypothetical protein